LKTDTDFRPCRKFPEYEVSADGVVRNRRHKNVVPQRVDPRDQQRRVDIIRNYNTVHAFVNELVNDAWPENRVQRKLAA